MHILLVSATEKEIEPLLIHFGQQEAAQAPIRKFRYLNHHIDVLITGVGMTATAYYMGKVMQNHYDCAINLGLAGSFNDNLEVGSVVQVVEDFISEMGAEDGEVFIPIGKMQLNTRNDFSMLLEINNPVLSVIPKVNGITVNTVHGNDNSIERIIDLYHPTVESMEGAAFLFACEMEPIPCAQIRAISNRVERRNRENWNIPLAITNLNTQAMKILHAFS